MIKIGFIEYFNSLPLYKNFQFENCEIIKGNPKQIAELLKNGEVDFGQLSVYEYLQNTDKYFASNRFCISAAKDRVASVLLLSKKPLKELHERSITLTSHSLTSVQLLKVLLNNKYGINPYWSVEEVSHTSLNNLGTDACLLIGDEALKAWADRQRLLSDGWQLYDLAKLWFEWKKAPFVFALFVGHKNKDLPQALKSYLENNLQTNLQKIDQIIDYIVRCSGESPDTETLKEYFSLLNYELDDTRLNSLKEFAQETGFQLNNKEKLF